MISKASGLHEQSCQAQPQESTDVADEPFRYPQGSYVDILDLHQMWKVGTVLEYSSTNHNYRIRMEQSKHDEIIGVNSPRLAVFRTYTQCISSNPRTIISKPTHKFTMGEHIKRIEELKKFVARPLSEYTSFQFVQLIKGSHFYYTDYLLSYALPDVEAFAAAREYLATHLSLTNRYMSDYDVTFRRYWAAVYREQDNNYPAIELEYAEAFSEILDVAIAILGGRSHFIRENRLLIQQHLDLKSHTYDDNSNDTYVRMLFSANFFKNGGIDNFDRLVKGISEQEILIPFEFLRSLFGLYNVLDRTLTTDIRQKCRVGTMIEIVQRNIDRMKDEDLKQIDRDHVMEVIKRIELVADSSFDSRRHIQRCEEMQLHVIFRYLQSPVFQNKKDSCDAFTDFFGRITSEGSKRPNDLTPHHFFDWIRRHKVLEYLMGDSSHSEIFRRGADLLKMFGKTKLLNEQIIDLLWAARIGKHDEFVKLIYQIIVSLTDDSYLSAPLLEHLTKKIQSVPVKDWDEDYLVLVKDYILKVLQQGTREYKGLGVFCLYQYYILRKCPKALFALNSILCKQEVMETAKKIYSKCLQCIENNQNTVEHVRLLKGVASTGAHEKSQVEPLTIVLKDIKRNAADSSSLTDRLDLLSKLMEVFPTISLKKQDIKEIWDTTMQYPASFDVLLRHLIDDIKPPSNKAKDQQRRAASAQLPSYILYELIGGLTNNQSTCSVMSPYLFDAFQFYFRQVNYDLKSLEMVRGDTSKFNVVDASTLKGLNLLWNIFLQAEQSISLKALEFLIELHTKTSIRSESRKDQFSGQLINEALNRIRQNLKNNVVVARCLELLRKMVEKSEKRGLDRGEIDRKYRNDLLRQSAISNSHSQEDSNGRKGSTPTSAPLPTPPLPPQPPGHFEHSFTKKELYKNISLLLSLLETDSASRAWKIINQLPFSEECDKLIDKLESPFAEICSGSIYHTLYLLQIIEKKRTLSPEWWTRFVISGGIRMLLSGLDIELKCSVQEYYSVVLTSVLCKYYSQHVRCVQRPEDVCAALLRLLQRFMHHLRSVAERRYMRSTLEYDHQRKLVSNIFKIVAQHHHGMEFLSHPALFEMIQTVAVYSHNSALKHEFWMELGRNVREYKTSEKAKQVVLYFVVDLFEEIVKVRPAGSTQDYFRTVTSLLDIPEKATTNQLVLPHLQTIFERLAFIIHNEPQEKNADERNTIMGGCFSILTIIIQSYSELLREQQLMELFKYVLDDCLFEYRTERGGSKCKNQDTRIEGFRLIATMIYKLPGCLPHLFTTVLTVLKTGDWRTRRLSDWCIAGKFAEKSQTGYVGIDNAGCICYMTSFFQQMYMIPSLRQAIFEAEDPQFNPATKQNNILYQLKVLFASLQYGEEESFDPRDFCESFKDHSGNPINIYEQMDVDEFTNILFDRLENQLKGGHNFINEHFGGIMANEIICRGCPHSSEKEEPFLSISLEVKNKRDIYQSLEALVKGQPLEGQNAYQCDICQKKVAATKRVSLKRLPNHLIIVLKRLEFNYDIMQKTKINDLCEFPMRLNLRQYSQQHLHTMAGKNPELLDQMPDDYYTYELKGTVIHMGFADAGHYYSLIRQRNRGQNWFEFNDSVVRSFDPERLPDEAFGADTETGRSERRRNSYILIYDRNNLYNERNVRVQPIIRDPVYRHCDGALEQIKQHNENMNQRRIMFTKSMMEFFYPVLRQIPNTPGVNEHQSGLFRMCVSYFFSVVIRQSERRLIFELANHLMDKMRVNSQLAVQTIEILCHPLTIREILIINPNSDRRKLLANIIVQIYEIADKPINDLQFRPIQQAFFTSLLFLATERKWLQMEAADEMFMVMYKLTRNSQLVCEFLLESEAIGRLIESNFHSNLKTYPQIQPPLLNDPNSDCLYSPYQTNESEFTVTTQRRKQYELQRNYLWGLLSELLKQCDLLKPSLKRTFDGLNFKLPEKQRQLLVLRDVEFLDEEYTKFGLRKLGDVLATISTDDLDQTEILINWVVKSIRKNVQGKFRVVYAVYKQLVHITDDYQEVRMEAIEQIIQQVANETYFEEQEISVQYILKIVRKSPELLDYLSKTNLSREMIKVIRKNQSKDITSSRIRDINKSQHPLHGVRIPRTNIKYLSQCERRITEWEKIRSGEPIPRSEWDSDDDLADEKDLEIERVISHYNESTFHFEPVTVKNLHFDYLTLSGGDKPIGTWKDSEFLSQQNIPESSEGEQSQFAESSSEGMNDQQST